MNINNSIETNNNFKNSSKINFFVTSDKINITYILNKDINNEIKSQFNEYELKNIIASYKKI